MMVVRLEVPITSAAPHLKVSPRLLNKPRPNRQELVPAIVPGTPHRCRTLDVRADGLPLSHMLVIAYLCFDSAHGRLVREDNLSGGCVRMEHHEMTYNALEKYGRVR